MAPPCRKLCNFTSPWQWRHEDTETSVFIVKFCLSLNSFINSYYIIISTYWYALKKFHYYYCYYRCYHYYHDQQHRYYYYYYYYFHYNYKESLLLILLSPNQTKNSLQNFRCTVFGIFFIVFSESICFANWWNCC